MYSIEITTLLIVFGITIFFFLIFREIVCWYWKINKTTDLLSEQNLILKMILKEIKTSSQDNNLKSEKKSEKQTKTILETDETPKNKGGFLDNIIDLYNS